MPELSFLNQLNFKMANLGFQILIILILVPGSAVFL